MTRKLILFLATLSLVAVACGGGTDRGSDAPGATAGRGTVATPTDGTPAPSQTFALFDGSPATLADFRGRPVVLNFWASWCPSCVAEMSAAFRPVQERLGDEVTFVGMNIQDLRGLADDLLDETGVQWVNAEDPDGALYVELGGLGMPFTVFIDASGNIVDEHNGPLTEDQLTGQINELFGISA